MVVVGGGGGGWGTPLYKPFEDAMVMKNDIFFV